MSTPQMASPIILPCKPFSLPPPELTTQNDTKVLLSGIVLGIDVAIEIFVCCEIAGAGWAIGGAGVGFKVAAN